MSTQYEQITNTNMEVNNHKPTEVNPANSADSQSSEARLWNSKGNLHFNNNEYNDAILAYNTAIKLDRSFGWPYSNLALVYQILNRIPEAVVLYQKGISLLDTDQEKSAAWNQLGNIYRRINDPAKAQIAYQKADELNGNNPDQVETADAGVAPIGKLVTWAELGDLFFNSGIYKEAEKALIQAVKISPDSSPILSKLGMTFVFQGRYEEAISIYLKAIEFTTNNGEKSSLFNRLGNVYRRLNNQEQALEAYQKAVALVGTKSRLLTRTRFSLLSNCYSN